MNGKKAFKNICKVLSIFFLVAFSWINYLSLNLKEAVFMLGNNFLLQWLVGRFQGCLTDPWSSEEDFPAVELQGPIFSVMLLVAMEPRDFSNHFMHCFSASQRWCTWSRGRTMLMMMRRRRTQTAWCPPSWRRWRNWTNTFRNPTAMSVCGISPREHVSCFTPSTMWGSSVFFFRSCQGQCWMRSNICASLQRSSTSSWSETCCWVQRSTWSCTTRPSSWTWTQVRGHTPPPHPTLTTPQDAARSVGLRMKLIAGLLLWTGMGPLSLSDNII